MAEEANKADASEVGAFEKAIRQISAMPYYTWPLNDAAIDSLFRRYNKAVALADEAVSKAEGRQP